MTTSPTLAPAVQDRPPLLRSQILRFDAQTLDPVCAHGGRGALLTRRVLTAEDGSGLDFVDFTALPAGVSVGSHTHGPDEEEHYLILSGQGEMTLDGAVSLVGPGDLIVNRPGGTHALSNPGPAPLRMVVWQVRR